MIKAEKMGAGHGARKTELQYFYCAQNRKQQLDIKPADWYTRGGQRKAATIEGG